MPDQPFVSVIVPVKDRPEATQKLVTSFLNQNYPTNRRELIIVGDVDDSTWRGIEEHLSFIRVIETDIRSDGRDANAKRNVGLLHAKGDVFALTDSDIELPPDWIQIGVNLLQSDEHQVVAGGMISVEQGNFLADYIDLNPLGSKTSRMNPPYVLTRENSGKGRYKPPITANFFFTREVYEAVGGLDADFVTPYEDYPYADKIVWHGYTIFCTHELDVYHSHRDSAPDLAKEYWRAGIGCADYVLRYGESHLAKARTRQLVAVLAAIPAWIICCMVLSTVTLMLTVLIGVALSGVVAWQVGKVSALWYPTITIGLSLLFSLGMVYGFIYRTIKGQMATSIIHIRELDA